MFHRNSVQHLQTEVAGLVFPNPAGVPSVIHKTRFSWLHRAPEAGFLVLTPPSHEEVLPWIKGLSGERGSSILAVDIKTDIVRSFSLVYDFADFIIIDPDSDMGIDAVDISDIQSLLDELVSLRLCYERYTPVFLRLSHGTSPDELKFLLGACRLNGLDGVVVSHLSMLGTVRELTQGRVPVICRVNTPEEGLQALEGGASLLELPDAKPLGKLLKALENKQKI